MVSVFDEYDNDWEEGVGNFESGGCYPASWLPGLPTHVDRTKNNHWIVTTRGPLGCCGPEGIPYALARYSCYIR